MTPDSTPTPNRWFGRLAAGVILTMGTLPVVNWIPGGRQAPWYDTVITGWLSGSLIVLGGGIVFAMLTRGWSPPTHDLSRIARSSASRPSRTGWLLAGAAFALYALMAHAAFDGVPLHLDELAQVAQARVFASGRLWMETGPYPEFRSALHFLDDHGRWYSQFPPGWPALLAVGVWLHATWLIAPALGAVSVAAFWGIARRACDAPVALAAALLFAVTPFIVFMSASHMNHVGALCFSLLAALMLCRLDDGLRFAAGVGLAIGAMAMIRPLDAAAFGLPAALWIAWRVATRPDRWRELVASGMGVAVMLGVLLWYNARTTGTATLFAYDALWGPGHGLGFHTPPWGEPHTPARGLELLSLYFLRLQTYLFESPFPSLLLAAAGLAFGAHAGPVVRYWLASGALLVAGYWAYWHDGFYLGPRFLYLLVPGLVLGTVDGVRTLSAKLSPGLWRNSGMWTLGLAAGMAIVVNTPARFAQYRAGLSLMRQDPTRPARELGVRGALILVRESWGAQLVPRLWALGVSRPLTEALYGRTDACVLEAGVRDLELRGIRGPAAVAALLPLMKDSLRLERSQWSPDASERVLPGHGYDATCRRRILEDRAGFTVFLPVLARDDGGNTYVRDLHARDSVLLSRHAGRTLFLLRSDGPAADAALVLEPVRLDSLRAEWALK